MKVKLTFCQYERWHEKKSAMRFRHFRMTDVDRRHGNPTSQLDDSFVKSIKLASPATHHTHSMKSTPSLESRVLTNVRM